MNKMFSIVYIAHDQRFSTSLHNRVKVTNAGEFMSVKDNGITIHHSLKQPPQIRVLFFKAKNNYTSYYKYLHKNILLLSNNVKALIGVDVFYQQNFLRKKKTLAPKRPLDTML